MTEPQELVLDTNELEILRCVEATKGMPRHCAKHAVLHLERAWRLKDLDPEMAIFRAITAEEEAATALLVGLRERGYSRAKAIKFRDHAYKQGLLPFMLAVGKFVDSLRNGPKFGLRPTGEGAKRRLELVVTLPGVPPFYPIPPLGFAITSAETGQPVDFSLQLDELAKEAGQTEILTHIRKEANARNLLLYADSGGIPRVISGLDIELERRRAHVFMILTIYCLIVPYKDRAIFVEHALDAFLRAMGQVERQAHEEQASPTGGLDA